MRGLSGKEMRRQCCMTLLGGRERGVWITLAFVEKYCIHTGEISVDWIWKASYID